MTLALNLRRQLSGNRFLILAVLSILAACSPKIAPKPPVEPKEKEPLEQPKPVEKRFKKASLALLVPFELQKRNPKALTKAQVPQLEMPLDFYQGFKMGIDSAARIGQDFELNVFDTQDNTATLQSVLATPGFQNNHLIVGPVFPLGLQAITAYSLKHQIPVVSPLAASHPIEFNNPNLISLVNNIDQHAEKIAAYISKNYNPENTIVVVINSNKPDEKQFAEPLKAYFDNQSQKRFVVQEYANVSILETRMQRNKQYAVVVASAERSNATLSLGKLFRLKNLSNGYPIQVYGHPNWAKLNLSTEQLQGLSAIISSSYYVDYKASNVGRFVRNYRAAFQMEPSEFAFKGFDAGYFFGRLMHNYGPDFKEGLLKEKYKGLHNSYQFSFNPAFGYVNTYLMLLQYKNFSLTPIN